MDRATGVLGRVTRLVSALTHAGSVILYASYRPSLALSVCGSIVIHIFGVKSSLTCRVLGSTPIFSIMYPGSDTTQLCPCL